MNIETPTIQTTAKTETSTSATATNTGVKEDSKSFKDELATIKTQEAQSVKATGVLKAQDVQSVKTMGAETTTKAAEILKTQDVQTSKANEIKTAEVTEETVEMTQGAELTKSTNLQQAAIEKNVKNNLTQEVVKDKLAKDKGTTASSTATAMMDPISELNSKIATLNEIKNVSNLKTQKMNTKIEEISDKDDYCKTMKMDNKDITFFVNLVANQEISAQSNQRINQTDTNFTDIKTKETQAPVHVSATLMDAINESAKTNKPFRIDFDNNIAVIMKVDKNGVLSANFIPGDAAVENYLRNNMASLRQSFDEQNLPYSNLSYSNQQKQQQQKQNKNKENGDV